MSAVKPARLLPALLLVVVAACVRGVGPASLLSSPASSLCAPGQAHLLGCSLSGADLLAVLGFALLRSFAVGVGCTVVCALIGVALALCAEGLGGRAPEWLRRVAELVQAVPGFLVALVLLATTAHPNVWSLAAALCVTGWTPFTRLAIARLMSLRAEAFVEAALALGYGRGRTMWVHLAPNLLPVVAVQFGASASAFVLTETSLSFLGIGVTDGLSMGALLDAGVTAMFVAPHLLPIAACSMVLLNLTLLSLGKAWNHV